MIIEKEVLGMKTTIALGSKVKELRENAGLTQAHMATFIGVDQSHVSKIEKGERALSTDMLEKLSALFCYPLHTEAVDEISTPSFKFAFRTAGLEADDLLALAAVNRIALNQLQMDTIAGGAAHD